jgi:hypothetical protein
MSFNPEKFSAAKRKIDEIYIESIGLQNYQPLISFNKAYGLNNNWLFLVYLLMCAKHCMIYIFRGVFIKDN